MSKDSAWYRDHALLLSRLKEDSQPADGRQSADTPPPKPEPQALPEKIGHFRVVRVIASGGMGTVYEAAQEHPSRSVAVKVMKHGVASRSAMRRFEYESQILARLRHPCIAQIYEAGTHDDGTGAVPFFAMEYIPNARPITRYAFEQKLATRQRLELFAQVGDAVHHGHQNDVIHRDLKPSNILVDSEGRVRIIDFGVARGTDSDMAITTLQTDIGQLIGTLQYMSPEQCQADPGDLDIRSDVYALGVVLYELLSEKLPYDVGNKPIFESMRVIREQQPGRLSAINATLKGDAETIVLKALEKDRERRYQSASELVQDIRRYLAGEPIEAKRDSITYRLRKRMRRHRASFGLAIALIVVGTIAVANTFTPWRGGYRSAPGTGSNGGEFLVAAGADDDSICRPGEIAKLQPADIAADDRFGWSVDLCGDTVVIGAPGRDRQDAKGDSGSAYVYRYDGASWIQEAKLLKGDDARHNRFGTAVALSGDTAVVNARHSRRFHGKVWRCDTTGVFSDSASWTAYDPKAEGVGERPGGYWGAVFDGRYVYFVPHEDDAGYHAEVLRYDTAGDFATAASWTAFDPGDHGVGDKLGGYFDAVFDGRFVYFAGDASEILRCDTERTFEDPRSWATFNPHANGVGEASTCFSATVFDGRYVYFGRHSGEVLRYDTADEFHTVPAWQAFDPGASGLGNQPESYLGAVFDGRYVYFAPWGAPSQGVFNGKVLRYDTMGSFDDTTSWATYDYGNSTACAEDPNCHAPAGYHGAVFDGQYVYFVPYRNETGLHGEVLRYDTTGAFGSPDSWSTFDPGDHGVGYDLDGYWGGTFDGRYVYFVPNNNGGTTFGEVLRYDTTANFSDPLSWSAWGAGDSGAEYQFFGYMGATFDGRYAYLAPFMALYRDATYVFHYDGIRWVQETKLQAADRNFDDCFGCGLSLEENTLVIGEPGDDESLFESGSANVFRRDNNGTPADPADDTWVQQAKLLPPEELAGQRFGDRVAIAGQIAVIVTQDCMAGKYAWQPCEADLAGAAHVFRQRPGVPDLADSTGGWFEEARLRPPDVEPGHAFGSALAIDGGPPQRIVVGAKYDDDRGEGAGAAYVFRFDGEAWVEEAKLLASDSVGGEQFGISVAIDGDIILVGAYTDGENGFFAGAAYVYCFDGTDWVEEVKLLPSDGKPNDLFGSAVSLDGDTAVIGACGWGGGNFGSAYVFGGFSDYNANGQLDLCDIARGVSEDRNTNGLPDECEPFPRRISANTTGQADEALMGPPDDRWCELGAGKVVEYDFGEARIVDGDGCDFNVYEFESGEVEFELVDVQVSDDGESFLSVVASEEPAVRIRGDGARGVTSTMFIRSYDLDGTGLSRVRFVRLVGLDDGYGRDGIGFDLDAIGAIHWLPPDGG